MLEDFYMKLTSVIRITTHCRLIFFLLCTVAIFVVAQLILSNDTLVLMHVCRLGYVALKLICQILVMLMACITIYLITTVFPRVGIEKRTWKLLDEKFKDIISDLNNLRNVIAKAKGESADIVNQEKSFENLLQNYQSQSEWEFSKPYSKFFIQDGVNELKPYTIGETLDLELKRAQEKLTKVHDFMSFSLIVSSNVEIWDQVRRKISSIASWAQHGRIGPAGGNRPTKIGNKLFAPDNSVKWYGMFLDNIYRDIEEMRGCIKPFL